MTGAGPPKLQLTMDRGKIAVEAVKKIDEVAVKMECGEDTGNPELNKMLPPLCEAGKIAVKVQGREEKTQPDKGAGKEEAVDTEKIGLVVVAEKIELVEGAEKMELVEGAEKIGLVEGAERMELVEGAEKMELVEGAEKMELLKGAEKMELVEDTEKLAEGNRPEQNSYWVELLKSRLEVQKTEFLKAFETLNEEKWARQAAEARSRGRDVLEKVAVKASSSAKALSRGISTDMGASTSSGGGGGGTEDKGKREPLVEQAEMHMEDITHQRGKKKKAMAASEVPRCEAEVRREKNMAEHRKMALELGLIKEKKPKAAAVKRKAPEVQLPTRRSGREKKAVKYFNSEDVDWEEEHYGKRRKTKEAKTHRYQNCSGGDIARWLSTQRHQNCSGDT